MESWDLVQGMCGLSRQVVSHGCGLLRQVSLYVACRTLPTVNSAVTTCYDVPEDQSNI